MKKELAQSAETAAFPTDPKNLMRRLKEKLAELADPGYARYVKKSTPGDSVFLGLTIPATREIAREIAAANGKAFLDAVLFGETVKKRDRVNACEFEFCEERLALGMIVADTKMRFDERLDYIAAFVPWIDSWLVCDVFCSSLKISNENRADYWTFLEPFVESSLEYELRFAVVAMLTRCLTATYVDAIFERIDRIAARNLGLHYADMAIAWLVATAFAKFPDATWRYLDDNSLNDFTFNKALQKILDSRRVDDATKEEIRLMKRPATPKR